MPGLVLIAAALVAETAVAVPSSLDERCPKLTAAERQEIEQAEKDRSVYFGLTWYAREECVSLADATRRMKVQQRDPNNPDSIENVQSRLQQNEAATFAGLWIEHQPTYRVVVAFTRDGATTLGKYTRDPVFVGVDRGGPTLAELNATRERLARELQGLGARPSLSTVDVRAGRVEIGVLGDLTAFKAAVARGEVQLPPFVHLQLPGPFKHAAPALPADWQKVVRAFPRARYRHGGHVPDVLRTGTVVLENGCLRLSGERRNSVIVWPNEAALDLTQPGKVRILNRISGKTVEVGNRIDLGGNSGKLAEDQEVVGADPACPGPYFAMGNFEPFDEAEIERRDLQGRAGAILQQRRVGEKEAFRLAWAEADRERRFRELSALLMKEAPESFAGIYPYQGRATFKFARDPQAELRRWVPADLRPFAKAERVPRPLAALKAEREAFLDDVERLGIKASAFEDIEHGRIVISSDELPALGRAASSGKVRIPASARVLGSGGLPEGQYSAEQMQAADRALEEVKDWEEMRTLVEGARGREITPSRSVEITRYLVSLGFTAEDLSALHAEGQFPAQPKVEQNGRPTVGTRALAAQEAVVGEVLDIKPELLGDGYRSTARLRVVEGLKGELQAGEFVEVRLLSGVGSDGKSHQNGGEPVLAQGLPGSLEPGSRWFLLLSEGHRAWQALRLGKTLPASGRRLFVFLNDGAWPIAGGQIAGTYREPGLGSLAQVRRQLAPVDAAFDRASRRIGKPLMRRIVGVK